MLKLYFASRVEPLEDKLFENISGAWKAHPCKSPTIIFADKLIEQWFRLNWVKKHGILANLKSVSLETFLWQSMAPGENGYLLSGDILQNVIHAALVSKVTNDKGEIVPYYSTLKGLDSFLNSGEPAKISFISSKIAQLFLEYEYSRPSNFIRDSAGSFKPGILDAWKQGASKPYFSKDAKSEDPIEVWQRALYGKIFHQNEDGSESFFSKAANNAKNDKAYLTLSYQYGCLTDAQKRELWKEPVYIFGLAGCSQFHRKILQDMSGYTDVYIYIQNPCAEFWEDVKLKGDYTRVFSKSSASNFKLKCSENASGEEVGLAENENKLLELWGRAGRDNIRLWCEATDYDFQYLDPEEPVTDTVLGCVQNLVLHRKSSSEKKLLEDDSLKLFSAPSRVREVETLKEQIFKDLEADPTLRLDEILVMVPKLDSYRIAIKQVFESVDKFKKEFLPYTIADAPESESLAGGAIHTLLQIAKTMELNRALLFDLLENPVVEDSLDIDASVVAVWKEWVQALHVYREKNDSQKGINPHSFSHGIRRLLLDHMMQGSFVSGDITYHPFGDISSSDEESLEKFCTVIEKLEAFIEMRESKNNIDEVRSVLRYFLTPKNFKEEAEVVNNVNKELNYARWQLYAGREKIPFDELEGIILRGIGGVREVRGSFLVSGLNFTSIKPTRAFSMKVVYILGMNAKDFPGTSDLSTLDLRVPTPLRNARFPGDTDSVARNRYAFLCTLLDTKEKLRISYLGKNLKKDEKLFPSSVVEDLKNYLNDAVLSVPLQEVEIALDEERPVEEIYSTNRLKKRNLSMGSFGGVDQKNVMDELKPIEIPKELSVKKILNFVNNPFEFQIQQVLRLDDSEDESSKELEPIALDNIQRSVLAKSIFEQKYNEGALSLSNEELLKLDEVKYAEETGALPEGIFTLSSACDLSGIFCSQVVKVKECFEEIEKGTEISVKVNVDLKDGKTQEILVKGVPEWLGRISEAGTLKCAPKGTKAIFKLCNGEISPKYKIELYLLGLLTIASGTEGVSLAAISAAKESWTLMLNLDAESAKKKISELLYKAYQDRYAVNWPSCVLEQKYFKASDYVAKLLDKKNGIWKYKIPEASLLDESAYGIPKDDQQFVEELNKWKDIFTDVFPPPPPKPEKSAGKTSKKGGKK